MSLLNEALKLSKEQAKLGWDGSCKGCKNLVAGYRCFVGNNPAACLACWEPELTVKAPAVDLSLPNKNGDVFVFTKEVLDSIEKESEKIAAEINSRLIFGVPIKDLEKAFEAVESHNLTVTPEMIANLSAKELEELRNFKPEIVLKGYSHRGYHTSETVTLVGYEKLMAFIKEEVEKNNAFEFHFWVST